MLLASALNPPRASAMALPIRFSCRLVCTMAGSRRRAGTLARTRPKFPGDGDAGRRRMPTVGVPVSGVVPRVPTRNRRRRKCRWQRQLCRSSPAIIGSAPGRSSGTTARRRTRPALGGTGRRGRRGRGFAVAIDGRQEIGPSRRRFVAGGGSSSPQRRRRYPRGRRRPVAAAAAAHLPRRPTVPVMP